MAAHGHGAFSMMNPSGRATSLPGRGAPRRVPPRAPPRDVAAYLAKLAPPQRAALERLRAQILAAAPKAEERISYQIPGFFHHGRLVWMAAFRDHCSFFPGANATRLARELGYGDLVKAKGTLHFMPEKPLPATLVKAIVKARVRENEANAGPKAKAKTRAKARTGCATSRGALRRRPSAP